jgi:hypothetical protein
MVGPFINHRNVPKRYKALINPDTEELYSIMGNGYKTLSHQEAFEMVLNATESFPEYGKPIVTTKFFKDGARMKASLRFPEVEVDVKGDKINPNIDIWNSYDGGLQFSLIQGAFRLICTNGMVIGEKFLEVHKKHTQGFTFYIKEELEKGMEAFSAQKGIWESWINKRIEAEEASKVIKELEFGKKETDELYKLIEVSSGLTLMEAGQRTYEKWLFFCLITQFITHNVKSLMRQKVLSSKINKLYH